MPSHVLRGEPGRFVLMLAAEFDRFWSPSETLIPKAVLALLQFLHGPGPTKETDNE